MLVKRVEHFWFLVSFIHRDYSDLTHCSKGNDKPTITVLTRISLIWWSYGNFCGQWWHYLGTHAHRLMTVFLAVVIGCQLDRISFFSVQLVLPFDLSLAHSAHLVGRQNTQAFFVALVDFGGYNSCLSRV